MFESKKIPSSNTTQDKIDVSNLIKIQKGYQKVKQKKSFFTYSFLGIILLIIGIFGILIFKQVGSISFDLNSLTKLIGFDLKLSSSDIPNDIKQSFDGKTNILIIGRGGDENDAPQLTDSILIASINYKKNSVSLFSVPRDLYVAFPNGGAGRINEAYSRGLRDSKDESIAIKNLTNILSKITWEEIHYFVNLDFEWFRKIIDTLGGIDINVPDAIVDTTYPGPNHTYQTFRISAGPQTLDGSTALKYARSRHTTSDFDRSLRQQLIIKALREKVLSLGLITSPSKIKSIYNLLQQYIVSDLSIEQMMSLALYLKDLPGENIVSSNLNDTCFYGSYSCTKGGFLYVPQRADFWGAAVLLQDGGSKSNLSNYSELMPYTNIVFNYPLVYSENLPIGIFNSTKVGGLAWDIAQELNKYGFTIPEKDAIWNTAWDVYEKSKILYVAWSGGTKPETVEALEGFIFWWSEAVEILPKYSQNPNTKIEIIIGNDYQYLNF